MYIEQLINIVTQMGSDKSRKKYIFFVENKKNLIYIFAIASEMFI